MLYECESMVCLSVFLLIHSTSSFRCYYVIIIVYWNYLSKFFLLSRCLLHKVETLHSSSNLFQLNIEFSYYIFSNLSCIRIQWNLMFVKDFYTIIPSTNSLEVILIILCCAERWNGSEKTKINEIKVSNGISR